MTTTGQNFEIYQGDDKDLVITVTDATDDLTSYNAVWVMYNITPETAVIIKTTQPPNGIIIASGQIIISLDGIDTENVIPKTYGHQCEIDDGLGHHSTITTGSVKVLKSMTHSYL